MREELKKLLKKDYSIMIGEKEVLYPQLSYYDCLEAEVSTDLDSYKLTEWLYEFLNKYSKDGVITIEEFNTIDINLLWKTLKNTAFKGYFGEEKEIDLLKKISESKELNTGIPMSAWIMSLVDRFKLDPITLLKKYTPEQLSEYQDGIIYIENEQTEEGRRKNKLNQFKKQDITKGNEEDNLSDIEILKRRIELNKQLKNNNNIN